MLATQAPPWMAPTIATEDLAAGLAQATGQSVASARRFLWTNLSNGGATLRGDADRKQFTAEEAYRFLTFVLKGSRFAPGSLSPEAQQRHATFARPAAQLFVDQFFGGAVPRWNTAQRFSLRAPIPLRAITKVHDGDTWRALFTLPGLPGQQSRSMRFASYDAPEVSGPKLKRQLQTVLQQVTSGRGKRLFQHRGEAQLFRTALESHLQYQGALTGLLWKDMAQWITARGGRFEMAHAFAGGAESPQACGLYEMVDYYGRWIGIPQVTDDRMLSRYLEERLPQLMATEGEKLRATMQAPLLRNRGLAQFVRDLSQRGVEGQAAAALINPALWIHPGRAFHPRRTVQMAAQWNQIGQRGRSHPVGRQISRDLSALTIFLGLGYHYVKYRSQRSPAYERIEQLAKANTHGLWTNTLMHQMEYRPDPGQCAAESATS
jgi:endonuclease YncB( thermonuclease family)